MEAAAALFMLGLLFLAGTCYARDATRGSWPLAAVAFALPWVRLEYVAIAISVTAMLGLLERSRREPSDRGLSASRVPRYPPPPPPPPFRLVVPFLGACAGILVYSVYNGIVFGGILPVSAATKRAWYRAFWEGDGGHSLARSVRNLLEHDAFGPDERWAMAAIGISLLLLWWATRRSRSRDDRLGLAFLTCAFGLVMGHLTMIVGLLTVTHENYSFHPWYFAPAYLMTALILPATGYALISLLRRWVGPRSPTAANVLSASIVVVVALILIPITDFNAPLKSIDTADRLSSAGVLVTSYMGTQTMDRLLPEDSVVGSWDAGVIGYFSRLPVVNLDGMVNSYDYLRATNGMADGYARYRDEFRPLYRALGITHLANVTGWDVGDHLLYEGPRDLPRGNNGLEHGPFAVWSVDPMADGDPATRLWERLSPHFDHPSDDPGLIVDGRIAQAFTRDCVSDELANWSWAWEGGGAGTDVGLWNRMQTGPCIATIVLPRDAVPPVRIEAYGPSGPTGEADPAARFWERLSPHFDHPSDDPGLILDGWRARAFTRDCAAGALAVWSWEGGAGTDVSPWRRTQTGPCIAEIVLPRGARATVRVEAATFEEHLARRGGDGPPAIRADFDVHLVDDGLLYLRRGCGADAVDARFFLHLDPVDPDDLSDRRRPYGFDNLDFDFATHGVDNLRDAHGAVCVAEVPLPSYAIAAIRTGPVRADGGRRHPQRLGGGGPPRRVALGHHAPSPRRSPVPESCASSVRGRSRSTPGAAAEGSSVR